MTWKTRVRSQPVRWIVVHWTGGRGDAKAVRRTLESRGLSVHAHVGRDGTITQWEDPRTVTCLHAGKGRNDLSAGIEVTCPGFDHLVDRLTWRPYTDEIHGERRRHLMFNDAQLVALAALCREWACVLELPLIVPTEMSGAILRRRLSDAELAAFKGIVGHYHLDPTAPFKRDPGSGPLVWLGRHFGQEVI